MNSTDNMNLIVWDDADDPYDHTELAANWQAIDDHDHTPGRGARITTNGLADHSVTRIKLALNAVSTNEIQNGTILGEDLASGIINSTHLDPTLLGKLSPLGVVTPWFRPSPDVAIPSGWVLADGQTVTEHSWGGGAVTVPNLVNRFVLGAAVAGTGSGPNLPPGMGDVGGNNTRNWNHSHPVPGHSHTVDAHSHTVNAHSHSVNAHSHSISSDGSHNHSMHSRLNAFLQGISVVDYATRNSTTVIERSNNLQSLYVAGYNNGSVDDVVPGSGAHSHGGSTGDATAGTTNASPGTSSANPGTSSVGLTTDAVSVGGDIRPAYCGLLYIIKVKN